MKVHNPAPLAAATILALAMTAVPSINFAQCTLITYQGLLNEAGKPASGLFGLRFALYTAETGGTREGPVLTNTATAVDSGMFNVALDFGNVFDGSARWLEIGVRTNGGSAFATLVPRQLLTASPYAITAGNVTGPIYGGSILPGTITGAQLANGAVAAANLASNSVTAGQLAPGGGAVESYRLRPKHRAQRRNDFIEQLFRC